MDDFLDGYDPEVVEDLVDYGAGSVPGTLLPSLREQEKWFPTFAVNYVSLNQSGLCFDNPSLSVEKFISLLTKCKELNDLTYQQLIDSSRKLHRFHIVEPHKLKKVGLWRPLCDLWRITPGSRTEDELPEIYQFGLYTKAETEQAPRVLGFVGRWGVFYLLWFDVDHLVYTKK